MIIHEASEGNEALQTVDSFHPELIFMDIRLPGENGFQLTHKIKTTCPDIKVMILTGYDILEYREAAIRSGADGFVAKDSLGQVEMIKSIILNLSNPQQR